MFNAARILASDIWPMNTSLEAIMVWIKTTFGLEGSSGCDWGGSARWGLISLTAGPVAFVLYHMRL